MNFFDEEIILDYLEGNLDGDDSKLFEAELASNEKLSDQVESYRNIILAVRLGGRKKLSQKINSITDNNLKIDTTNFKKSKTIHMNTEKKNSRINIWTIAAGLAFLVIGYGVGKSLKGSQEKVDPKEMFSNNYDPSSSRTASILTDVAKENISSRGADTDDKGKKVMYRGEEITKEEFDKREKLRRDTLMQGLKLFEQSKWGDSKVVLHSYTENHKEPVQDYAVALYYLAKTSLNQELYGVAVENLELFLSTPCENQLLVKDAEWERALCYLIVNENKSKVLFENMAGDNTHAYQDEAKSMLAYFD